MNKFFKNVWEEICSLSYRINHLYRDIQLSIVSFFQRLFRGYADEDLWNFDHTIAVWMVPRLRAFRNQTFGYPTSYETFEEWQADLDKMIKAFEFYRDYDKIEDEVYDKYKGLDDDGSNKWIEEMKKRSKEAREGMDLLVEHFGSLWW